MNHSSSFFNFDSHTFPFPRLEKRSIVMLSSDSPRINVGDGVSYE
jgi:hypothetical protein